MREKAKVSRRGEPCLLPQKGGGMKLTLKDNGKIRLEGTYESVRKGVKRFTARGFHCAGILGSRHDGRSMAVVILSMKKEVLAASPRSRKRRHGYG